MLLPERDDSIPMMVECLTVKSGQLYRFPRI